MNFNYTDDDLALSQDELFDQEHPEVGLSDDEDAQVGPRIETRWQGSAAKNFSELIGRVCHWTGCGKHFDHSNVAANIGALRVR